MTKLTRRALSRYTVDQLLAGKSAKTIAKHLAATMVESGSIHDIDFMIGDVASELEQRRELATGHITSATPLSSELRNELKKRIKKATGAKAVLLEEQVDGSVIGGVRIETSSRVWDSTVARRLADLREAF